jgi:hypothetical protein
MKRSPKRHDLKRGHNRDPHGPYHRGAQHPPDTATNPATSPPGPSTMPALMRMLGLSTASARHQHEALKQWLASNTPHLVLRISLRQNGYGLLLDALFGRHPGHHDVQGQTDQEC